MINAKAKGFGVRQPDTGIHFISNSPSGKAVSDKTLSDCANATLKFKDQRVLVESLSAKDPQSFTGRVRGFEPAVRNSMGCP